MSSARTRAGRAGLIALPVAGALLAVAGGPAFASHANVTAVQGSAYGVFGNVSLFGGPFNVRGPHAPVTLPPGGSATPVTNSVATSSVVYGPAILFSSGPVTTSTQGVPGASGSVTTSTNIQSVNTSQQEVFTAAGVSSTCTANEAGVTRSATITNGFVTVSEGNPDVDGDETNVPVPTNPAPNTAINGVIEGVGDSFKYVFNEQTTNPGGSFTVNAAHLYLLGPTAVGDLIIGQSVCGATVVGATGEADFDGNGTTDRSVYRNGGWYVQGQGLVFLGLAGDIPVPGNYDADPSTERGVYRDGAWYVEGQPTVFLGLAGYIPVPGDYDGDGITDRAVYKDGAWYVEGQDPVFFGLAGYTPVPADYDGDGDTDLAVYKDGAWYVQGQPTVFLGLAGDIPVPGDYDGDGDVDRAVFRDGAWYVDGQAPVFLGLLGDVPVPGNYDADTSTERAVFRDGAWYVEGQNPVFFGLDGDVPVPLPSAIYRSFL